MKSSGIPQSKSASKKKGRNIIQQTPVLSSYQNGVSLRRIDKLRASSQLAHIAQSNNITIDFDNIPSREGAQSTLAHFTKAPYTFSSIEQNESGINSNNTQDINLNNTTTMNTMDYHHPNSGNSSLQNINQVFNSSSLFQSATKK